MYTRTTWDEATAINVNRLNNIETGISDSHIAEMGANSNGTYIRWDNGLQICYHELTLTYSDVAALRKTWTFPASFTTAPSGLSVTLADGTASFTPSKANISYVGGDNSGTATSITLAMYRITGTTDFLSGDTVNVKCIAIGRWN